MRLSGVVYDQVKQKEQGGRLRTVEVLMVAGWIDGSQVSSMLNQLAFKK
jgi:hypothetical protein